MLHETINLTKDTQGNHSPEFDFGISVLMGLESTPKTLLAKYLYDDRGSVLFEKITETVDYYPTNCEAEIFSQQGKSICEAVADNKLNLIELGAGDGRKTQILIDQMEALGKEVTYIPIDISAGAIEGLVAKFSKQFPNIKTKAIVGEYFEGLTWVSQNVEGPNLMLFLGSNIGNFNGQQRLVFLRALWNCLNHDDRILVGFDLKKDFEILLRAYNDSEGVTEAFNINLLDRINRELGGDIDTKNFFHYGTYNPNIGAMESYLISRVDQTVNLTGLEKSVTFHAYEPIHIEYSFKFLPKEIESLGQETGFCLEQLFTDEKKYFADALMRVEKDLQ